MKPNPLEVPPASVLARFTVKCAGQRSHRYTASYRPSRCRICGGRVITKAITK